MTARESPGRLRLRLGRMLQARRIMLGLSVADLATKVRVAARTIERWEGAETEPTLANAILWADALGMRLDLLTTTELSEAA